MTVPCVTHVKIGRLWSKHNAQPSGRYGTATLSRISLMTSSALILLASAS